MGLVMEKVSKPPERAHSLAYDAVRAVALQCRRLHRRGPEDDTFVFRWWADLQFFIVVLRRLRRAAQVAAEATTVETTIAAPSRSSTRPSQTWRGCATWAS